MKALAILKLCRPNNFGLQNPLQVPTFVHFTQGSRLKPILHKHNRYKMSVDSFPHNSERHDQVSSFCWPIDQGRLPLVQWVKSHPPIMRILILQVEIFVF